MVLSSCGFPNAICLCCAVPFNMNSFLFQGTLKSALMSRATRERRKSCPVSVRFEEKPEVVSLSAPSVLSINIIKQVCR